MDQISNNFVDGIHNIVGNLFNNILLIIPVIFVFAGAAFVFMFGLKKPEEPKLNKRLLAYDSNTNSNSKKSLTTIKKKKKSPTPATTTNNTNSKSIKTDTGSSKTSSSNIVNHKSKSLHSESNNEQSAIVTSTTTTTTTTTVTVGAGQQQLKKPNKQIEKAKKPTSSLSQSVTKSTKSSNTKTASSGNNTKSKNDLKKTDKLISSSSSTNDGWQTVISRNDKKHKKIDTDLIVHNKNQPNHTAYLSEYLAQDLNAEVKRKSNSPTRNSTTNQKNTSGKITTTSTTNVKLLKSKNQKQIKDEVNNSKKQADDAENIKNNKTINSIIDTNDIIDDNGGGGDVDKIEKSTKPIVDVDYNESIQMPTHFTSEEFEEFVAKKLAAVKQPAVAPPSPPIETILKENPVFPNKNNMNINSNKTEDEILDIVPNKKKSAPETIKEFAPEFTRYDLIQEPAAFIRSNDYEYLKNQSASLIANAQLSSIPSSGNVAFDELGEAWTEAKPVKKGKKRVRKE